MEKSVTQHSASNPETAKELDLLRRIQEGDQRAESILFNRYKDVLQAIVRKRLGNASADDVNDVCSDVFLAMLHSLRDGKFDVSKGQSLGSYLYGIARFKLMDYLRKKSTQTSRLDDLSPAQEPSVSEDNSIEQEERSRMLQDAMEKLKPKYREVLYLRYFKDLSIPEISEELGLPTRRVSERIHYAVKLLRERCRGTDLFSIFVIPFRIPDVIWRILER